MNLNLITCIVEKGKADNIVDAALKAGAQAATVFFARGRGIREKLGTAGKLIQAEKEVILIVTKKNQTTEIFNTIISIGNIKDPGKGFAYIQPVENAVGFID